MEAPQQRIRELTLEIEELKARWPAHSVPPALLQALEDLEEELERLQLEARKEPHDE